MLWYLFKEDYIINIDSKLWSRPVGQTRPYLGRTGAAIRSRELINPIGNDESVQGGNAFFGILDLAKTFTFKKRKA